MINNTKRQLLKGLAAGAIWTPPIVSSVTLPAHAAATLEPLTASTGPVPLVKGGSVSIPLIIRPGTVESPPILAVAIAFRAQEGHTNLRYLLTSPTGTQIDIFYGSDAGLDAFVGERPEGTWVLEIHDEHIGSEEPGVLLAAQIVIAPRERIEDNPNIGCDATFNPVTGTVTRTCYCFATICRL